RQGLTPENMGGGDAGVDTRTHPPLLGASQFIETNERRAGFKDGGPEEKSLPPGWVDAARKGRLPPPPRPHEHGADPTRPRRGRGGAHTRPRRSRARRPPRSRPHVRRRRGWP